MKEIGGYFELDYLKRNPYYNNMIELNTGRNALAYIIKARDIKKVYIPQYLCNSISDILDRHSVNYETYKISDNFHPLFDKELKNGEYLFVINYFGQISNNKMVSLKERYGSIIVDNTQAFFESPIQDVDTIYSLRKYFGLPDGAYLSTDELLTEKLEEDKSSHRMKHILGRFEGKASNYYKDFKENDHSFKTLSLKKMSRLSQNILGAIDYERVLESRNRNFNHLHRHLKHSNDLNISIPKGPFSYPYYIENGVEVRKRLVRKNIYIPTLWPNVLREADKDSLEYKYSANILPLPCDQRYEVEDMKTLIKELNECNQMLQEKNY